MINYKEKKTDNSCLYSVYCHGKKLEMDVEAGFEHSGEHARRGLRRSGQLIHDGSSAAV